MQRTFKGAERGSDCRVHIGHGRSGDARGKCRRVEFVLGIEHQDGVKHLDFPKFRRLGFEPVKKISRKRQVGLWRKQIQPLLDAVAIGHQRGDFRNKPDCFAQIRFMRMVIQIGVEHRQHRDART